MIWIAPETWPFGAALALMLPLLILEGVGLVLSASPSDWLDAVIPDGVDHALGWLHLGKVPFLVLLGLFLTGFALGGYALQTLAHAIVGTLLPPLVAAVPATFVAISTVNVLGGLLAKFNSAEIDKNLTIQKKNIEADRETKIKQAEQRQSVELANQDASIAIARKSQEQSQADAAANQALSEAVKAEEAVNTAREVAVAERGKAIQLIDAARVAEQDAIAVTVAAQAEREAAENRAMAIKVEAEAKRSASLAEAEGICAINEAKNRLGVAQIDLQVRMRLIEQLPQIIQQASKPMEKIDSIRLFQVNGMPNGAVGGGDGGNVGGGSLPEQVMNSALQYQVAKPIVDAIMKDAGLANPSLTGIAQTVADMVSSPASASPTEAA